MFRRIVAAIWIQGVREYYPGTPTLLRSEVAGEVEDEVSGAR